MKIALLGATGRVGQRITNELLSRGHSVTAISRHVGTLEARPGLSTHVADVQDAGALTDAFTGHDAVVHSVMFLATNAQNVIGAVKAAHVPRLLVVGGAGSLEVAPGLALVDTPEFPTEYKAEALAGRAFLEALRHEGDPNWTFLSPSALFIPGERTGQFRVGDDKLLVDETGQSVISFEDFAIALVDEIEEPKHIGKRFTVGY